MGKKLFLLCLALFLVTTPGVPREVGNVNIPEKLKAGKTELILNGAGIRKKLFVKVYSAGLYLKKKNNDYKKIIKSNEPMAIKIYITTGLVSSSAFIDATEKGFVRSTNGNTKPIRKKIDSFIGVFKDEIKDGDIFDIIYIPGTGTKVYKNNVYASTTKGLDLKQALFGIWIIDNPAHGNKSLRDGMLGLE